MVETLRNKKFRKVSNSFSKQIDFYFLKINEWNENFSKVQKFKIFLKSFSKFSILRCGNLKNDAFHVVKIEVWTWWESSQSTMPVHIPEVQCTVFQEFAEYICDYQYPHFLNFYKWHFFHISCFQHADLCGIPQNPPQSVNILSKACPQCSCNIPFMILNKYFIKCNKISENILSNIV